MWKITSYNEPIIQIFNSLNYFEIYRLEKITNNFLIGIFDIKNYGTIFKKNR